MRVLSFGCGVQTVALAAMSCLGDFEKPDFAVFGDTQWESADTYAYMDWFEKWAFERGLEIIQATKGNIRKDALDSSKGFASMPLWTLSETKEEDREIIGYKMPAIHFEEGEISTEQYHEFQGEPIYGPVIKTKVTLKKGILRRQCTNEYKIQVVRRVIRERAGIAKGKHWKGAPVEIWIGISKDEAVRAKDSLDKSQVHRWPLLEKGMSRQDCKDYLVSKGLPIPPKSACIGCPFHDNNIWRDMRDNHPKEFEDACDFDDKVRKSRVAVKNPVFLHFSAKPLREADLGQPSKQLLLNECTGFCGN